MSLWTAIQGASKYAAAVAAGDVADDEAKALRIGRCRTCPSATLHKVPLLAAFGGFCGEPFRDGASDSPKTCGCLCCYAEAPERAADEETDAVYRLRVLAALRPAGKASVGSEKCPQNKW